VRIVLVTPAPRGSTRGNRVTAVRWARILRQLGHRVAVQEEYDGAACDVLIALHARRSFDSAARFRKRHPQLPLIVALTGTDLYQDLHNSLQARRSLEWATRLVVLQPLGVRQLPEHLRSRARVIHQSAQLPAGARRLRPKRDVFEVCVLGHLRPVKDPFRTAKAARLLPETSRVRVLQIGAALSEEMTGHAKIEEKRNPRYKWLGERPRWQAFRCLRRSRLLVLTSKLEGGANVISEALAASVPVVSSFIPGSIGILGEDYPGYFPVGDAPALAALLHRAEMDREFYAELKARCRRLAPLVAPARELRSWKALIAELQ